MLDSSRAAQLHLPCTPDLLVTPSDLSAFAKPLPLASDGSSECPQEEVIGINPGRLAKGLGGGTFAHVHIRLAQPVQVHERGVQRHALSQRCRVDIIRI